MLDSQWNIKNISDVETETFDHFMENISSKTSQTSWNRSLSGVKMGRDSPICDQLHLKVVDQFQKNVPQCKCDIEKTLKIPPPT